MYDVLCVFDVIKMEGGTGSREDKIFKQYWKWKKRKIERENDLRDHFFDGEKIVFWTKFWGKKGITADTYARKLLKHWENILHLYKYIICIHIYIIYIFKNIERNSYIKFRCISKRFWKHLLF